MAKSIKADELENEIMNYLKDFVEDIEDGVKETTNDITKQAVEELKSTSPRGKGTRKNPYYKGWTRQKSKISRRKIYCKNS